jgi:hypothetical protein
MTEIEWVNTHYEKTAALHFTLNQDNMIRKGQGKMVAEGGRDWARIIRRILGLKTY